MANLAVQNGFKPEQIETSDVNMMSTVLGYAITGQPLEPLEIHAQGFSDEELLDPATALMRSCISEPRRMRAMIISIRYSQTYASDERNTSRVSIGR